MSEDDLVVDEQLFASDSQSQSSSEMVPVVEVFQSGQGRARRAGRVRSGVV